MRDKRKIKITGIRLLCNMQNENPALGILFVHFNICRINQRDADQPRFTGAYCLREMNACTVR